MASSTQRHMSVLVDAHGLGSGDERGGIGRDGVTGGGVTGGDVTGGDVIEVSNRAPVSAARCLNRVDSPSALPPGSSTTGSS
jgi:hypothetical protein